MKSSYVVTINKNGHPKQVLRNVKSVLEISDEVNEGIAGVAFHHKGHFRTFMNNSFDRITIEVDSQNGGVDIPYERPLNS